MFKIKEHVRKGVRMAAIGTAASFTLAGAARGSTLSFDPLGTAPTPSGGNGNFDNTTADWQNGSSDVQATGADNVHFGGTAAGGAVTASASVVVNSITFDTGGYTINGAGVITVNVNSGSNIISSATGINTISAPVTMQDANYGLTSPLAMNVTAGTLTVGSMTFGKYGDYIKTGAGTLYMNGTVTNTRTTIHASAQDFLLEVGAGTMVFSGSNNLLGGNNTGAGVLVDSGAILAGNATIQDPTQSNYGITVSGHVAPHDPTVSNSTGTFSVIPGPGQKTNTIITFTNGGSLDLNLIAPDLNAGGSPVTPNHDVFSMTSGTYAVSNGHASDGSVLAIDPGAVININQGLGDSQTLVPGTYDIVQLFNDPSVGNGGFGRGTEVTLNDASVGSSNFTIGAAPSGYSYQIEDIANTSGVTGSGGIDLVVTAVPEPSSLGMLTFGAGAFLLRRRRKSRATRTYK